MARGIDQSQFSEMQKSNLRVANANAAIVEHLEGLTYGEVARVIADLSIFLSKILAREEEEQARTTRG